MNTKNLPTLQDTKKMLEIVSNYRPEEMKMVFAKLAALKEALKAADMFHEASIQFAQLEALALIRAVELSNGEPPSLTGPNKKLRSQAAVWLFNMTERERLSVIEKCKEGKTLLAIYNELSAPTDNERAVAIKMELNRNVAFELKRDGVATINTEYNKRLIRSLPINLQSDVRDGLRNLLRKKGALGIGDNEGTYIMPESENSKIYDALEVRMNSISHDFAYFISAAMRSKAKPIYKINARQEIFYEDFLKLWAGYVGAASIHISERGKQRVIRKINDMLNKISIQQN